MLKTLLHDTSYFHQFFSLAVTIYLPCEVFVFGKVLSMMKNRIVRLDRLITEVNAGLTTRGLELKILCHPISRSFSIYSFFQTIKNC